MTIWFVKWMDGGNLRGTQVAGYDLTQVVSNLGSAGIYNQTCIISIERLPL